MAKKDRGSARKGRATESLVAASCILATGGELNALTGLVDDEGVDITFKRRNGTRTLDVQVKSRFSDEAGSKLLRDKGRFVANTREATFRPRDDLYMLFVAVDAAKAELGPMWLVPSKELAKKGTRSNPKSTGKQIRFVASAKDGSSDKWSGYRMAKAELPKAILAKLRAMESRAGRSVVRARCESRWLCERIDPTISRVNDSGMSAFPVTSSSCPRLGCSSDRS